MIRKMRERIQRWWKDITNPKWFIDEMELIRLNRKVLDQEKMELLDLDVQLSQR